MLPEPERNGQRIYVEFAPPRALVTSLVKLAMVLSTKGDRKLI
jgi:hypothetical protein